MKHLTPALLTLLTLACVSQAALVQPAIPARAALGIVTPTATAPNAPVGIVIVDGLTIRSLPNADAPVLGYCQRGGIVTLERCDTHPNGDIWGKVAGGYVAVRYQGRVFVDGVCQ